jgi:hypothetical protein
MNKWYGKLDFKNNSTIVFVLHQIMNTYMKSNNVGQSVNDIREQFV